MRIEDSCVSVCNVSVFFVFDLEHEKKILEHSTRSLVYKGMVYKGFIGPVLDFQKKLGF